MKSTRLTAPAMVYIAGEEMSREVMRQVLKEWVEPYLDTAKWQTFDLSCKNRDATNDKALGDAIKAGTEVGAIFKEPTITATAEQIKAMGLTKPQGSPNGKMRDAWNGFSIDRDTIAVPGLEKMMGYEKPVQFCRYPRGGKYGANHSTLGPGTIKLIYTGEDGKERTLVEQKLTDQKNTAVLFNNPLDNLTPMAHHFFKRALDANLVPYVVTKKTVFKWQEEFWKIMKSVFDAEFKEKFAKKGLLKQTGGELAHVLSDDATMKLVKWKGGGFAMVTHNYDGDILTDQLAAIYKSPGFISSILTGKRADGRIIREFEASHGTAADMYKDHLAGRETSLNPLGMVYALKGAINHSVGLALESRSLTDADADNIRGFTYAMYDSMCEAMAEGKGTRDLFGDKGLSTEAFVAEVAGRISVKLASAPVMASGT